MVGFMNTHKVIVRQNVFSTFSSAQNESELKGRAKSGKLKCQFSQVKEDLNFQEILKLVPITKKITKEKDNCDIFCLCSSIVCVVRAKKKGKNRELKKTINK
jgi:hypothetical protein